MDPTIRMPRHALRHDIRFDVTAVRDKTAFAAARRHSAWVRALRLILPAAVLVGVVGFGAITYLGSGPALEFSGLIVDPNGVVMEAPHISGVQDNGQPYEVEAGRAIQDNDNSSVVTLEGIDARLGISDSEGAIVGAGRGVYNTKASTLELTEGVTISTQGGLRATLDQADINLEAGVLTSTRPVEVHAAEGTIRGNQLEILEGGRRLRFSGGVSMTLTPSRSTTAPAAPTTRGE